MKYIKNAGVALSVLISMIAIYEWLLKPASQISASVYYNEYIAPLDNDSLRESLPKILSSEQFLQYFTEKIDSDDLGNPKDKRSYERAAVLASEFVRDRVVYNSEYKINESVNGFFRISIRNNGSQSAEGVRVTVPYLVAYSVFRTGKEGVVKRASEPIDIGTLWPKESLTIDGWTSIPLSNYSASDVYIVHKDGVASVEVFEVIGNKSLFYLFYRNFVPIVLVVVVIFYVAAGVFSTIKAFKSDAKNKAA